MNRIKTVEIKNCKVCSDCIEIGTGLWCNLFDFWIAENGAITFDYLSEVHKECKLEKAIK
jgi:hypothetical protein